MRRALIVAPGRGSYNRAGLGQLQQRSAAADNVLDVCDSLRRSLGRKTIRELDSAKSYRSSLHVAGEHASLLTFACSLADYAELHHEYQPVGVVGNSMGFYTALAIAEALRLEDAAELVETMGSYQARNVIGGQILYPMIDSDWRSTPECREVVEQALTKVSSEGFTAEWSINLGGYAVLGADKGGVKRLLEVLPPDTRGSRTFPIQLPLHSAFHTSLMVPTSERAQAELLIPFSAPTKPLIDGRGHVFRPRWTDPSALRSYTLGHQVYRPFDFTTAIHTALNFSAPDVVVALGPGNALGGPLARILVESGWRGLRDRRDFDRMQASSEPVLLSFGVTKQRARLV